MKYQILFSMFFFCQPKKSRNIDVYMQAHESPWVNLRTSLHRILFEFGDMISFMKKDLCLSDDSIKQIQSFARQNHICYKK